MRSTLITAGILLIAGFLIALGGYDVGQRTKEAEWVKRDLDRKEGEEAALRAAARAIANIEVKSEKHIQPLLTEVRTNTVYRNAECQHSPDSLRNLNALITGDEEPGGSGLPEANPPQ